MGRGVGVTAAKEHTQDAGTAGGLATGSGSRAQEFHRTNGLEARIRLGKFRMMHDSARCAQVARGPSDHHALMLVGKSKGNPIPQIQHTAMI